ncbi:hypothetical protein [Pseudanabaena minima]|uniref:hypothetical protein n=1 Tax=Pseudanabaena minima TaxID=890415 RepID=UPI003DA9B0CB
MTLLAGHGKDPRLIQPVLFSVGDRVVDIDGKEGVITHLSKNCINIQKNDYLTSHNLEISTPVIKATNHSQLVEILNPICKHYSGRYLPTFAVNALAHALINAKRGLIAEAIALLLPDVVKELKKPQKSVTELKEFLANLPCIDADQSADLEVVIDSEPKLSVAKLRMDEPTRVSVLVEVPKTELEILRESLADLQKEAIALESSGASPKGVWLEKSRPSKRNFDQVVWKSDKPHKWLNDKKSRYIGKVDQDEHKSALTQFAAGKRLQEIEKEIKEIEKKLTKIKE